MRGNYGAISQCDKKIQKNEHTQVYMCEGAELLHILQEAVVYGDYKMTNAAG